MRGSEIEKSLGDVFVAKPDREGGEGCNNPAVTKRDTKPPASDTDSAIRRFIVVIKTTVAIPAMPDGGVDIIQGVEQKKLGLIGN